LIALPDELLRGILRRAWADRPSRPAAEEVRAAAGLASVCRRWSALLSAPPLPLVLDFSAAHLSGAQHQWLFNPAQAGRVQAATFHSKDALWERSLQDNVFMALHGGKLLHLSGVPLQLIASVNKEEHPALDLSALRLTKLGIDCDDIYALLRTDNGRADSAWLWLERLPGALEELDLFGLYGLYLDKLAWALNSNAGLAERLLRLQTLRVTASECAAGLTLYAVPLLEGLPSPPDLVVEGSGAATAVEVKVIEQVRSVRIEASGSVWVWNDEENVALCVDRLCHAGLQAAELCAGMPIKLANTHEFRFSMCEVVRKMISRHGDRFAVKVEVAEDPDGGPGNGSRLLRLAWRRWPAPGAPDLQAARVAHERARAWAAA